MNFFFDHVRLLVVIQVLNTPSWLILDYSHRDKYMKQLRIGAFMLPRVGKHPMNSKLTIYNNIDEIENDLFGTVVRLLVVIGVYVVDYITGCH